MKLRLRCWVFALVPCLLFPGYAGAHGDLHERIVLVTREIAKDPGRAELYFQRAELYRFHGDWEASMADFEEAGRLDPHLPLLDLARAKMLLDAGRPSRAWAAIDAFLETHRDHPEALLVRARALGEEGQSLAAAADYSRALEQILKPAPEVYLARARVLAAAGEEQLARAVQGLDEGMQRLGPLVTLQLYAIELDVERGQFDAALARVDEQAARLARKETWLVRRGDILREAGRPEEARAAYEQAIAAIEILSTTLRSVPMTEQLESRARDALDELFHAQN